MRSITHSAPVHQEPPHTFVPPFCLNPKCPFHSEHNVCFGRNVNNVMQRMLLYRLYHNHYKAYRRRRPNERHESRAGIEEAWIEGQPARLYEWRPFFSRTPPD